MAKGDSRASTRSKQAETKWTGGATQAKKTETSAALPGWNFAALAQQAVQWGESEGSEGAATSKVEPSQAGRLHLIGTPIGNRGDITLRALLTLAKMDLVLCEDTRTSGALLQSYGLRRPLLSYHEHNAAAREAEVLERLRAGAQVGLVSDAGMPLVADPGARLVQACHAAGIAVTVCPGPSALLAALTLAPLPQQPFLFGGFLPPKSGARQKQLRLWQALPATLVFYETPQRLAASLQDMAQVLGAQRQAAVGRELTKLFEECRSGSLATLAAHYMAQPPKGEIVVMIAPPEAERLADDATLRALLEEALAEQSLRDAVNDIAAQTGRARDEVYALALALKKAADE